MRQRSEPRSFPLTRRAERRAGLGAASLPPPPPLPDAQSQGRLDRRLPGRAHRVAALGASPAGTRVASSSSASVRIAGERRRALGPAGRGFGEGAFSRACRLRFSPRHPERARGRELPGFGGVRRPESGAGVRPAGVAGFVLPSPARRGNPERSHGSPSSARVGTEPGLRASGKATGACVRGRVSF